MIVPHAINEVNIMTNKSRQRGFTLIETLIYIILFIIIIGGGMIGAYGVIKASDKTSSQAILEQESLFILRKIDWALASLPNTVTVTVTLPASDHLRITNGSTTYDFTISGGIVFLDGTQISSANVMISALIFVKTNAAGGRPASIQLSFTATGTTGNSQTFSATKYLRF